MGTAVVLPEEAPALHKIHTSSGLGGRPWWPDGHEADPSSMSLWHTIADKALKLSDPPSFTAARTGEF